MRQIRSGIALAALFALALPLSAQNPAATRPVASKTAPLGAPMTPAALKTRLEAYAADSMRGRLTGTPDNVKATRFIAAELQKLGLQPAGDNGTFLQSVPLVRQALDTAASTIANGDITYTPYVNYLPRNNGAPFREFANVPVVYAGMWGDSARFLDGASARGKVVIIGSPTAATTVVRLQALARFAESAAIVVANHDMMPPQLRAQLSATPLVLDGGPEATRTLPAYFHIPNGDAAKILGVASLAEAAPGREGRAFTGSFKFKKVPAEAYNVVAILPGSDAKLKDEYVAIGAHNDHVGVGAPQDKDSLRAFNVELRRKQLENNGTITQAIFESIHVNMDSVRKAHPVARMDSIYNGADDDGSGSMGVLEMARAFASAKVKPKRSILFIWHVGEELGLFGSEHFTDHPTVPREQIVAELNFDMIGRGKPGDELGGGPNYLQLIGSRRLSTQLGDMVESVSKSGAFNWKFDYQYDANGHPEQYYCRSDHYNYARYGIPIVFMTTGGHADYHEVTDEVETIDFAKLSKVTRFGYELGMAVGNLAERPVVDKPKPDPRGQCQQ